MAVGSIRPPSGAAHPTSVASTSPDDVGTPSPARAVLSLHVSLAGTISFFPTLLQAELAATPTQATLAFATIFAIGLITSPIVGALGDRFGHQRVGLLSPLVGAVGLSILLTFPTPFGLIVGTVTFSIGLVTFWPVMTAELIDGLADSTMGADYGATRAIFYAVGSLGPTYVGVIAERYSYVAAYTGFLGCFLLAAGVLAALAASGR